MQRKTIWSWRSTIAGLFALIAFFGGWHKLEGTAKPGSYTWLFDMATIVVGILGVLAVSLWPRKRDASTSAPESPPAASAPPAAAPPGHLPQWVRWAVLSGFLLLAALAFIMMGMRG